MMVKEVGIGRKKWLFAEKDEGRVMEENVARYGALFPESMNRISLRLFCRVPTVWCLVTVHVCNMSVSLCTSTN
jgi:hypothetical protein